MRELDLHIWIAGPSKLSATLCAAFLHNMQGMSFKVMAFLPGGGALEPLQRCGYGSILGGLDMFGIWIGLLGSYRTIPFLGLFSGGSQVIYLSCLP